MSLIRFKEPLTLAFIRTDNSLDRITFERGEVAEFTIQDGDNVVGDCTLKAADGKYAPYVRPSVFEVLPEGFTLYRFTRNISLFFGIYDYGMDHWIYDVGQRLYSEDSVHALRVFHGAPVSGNFTHYQNPDGQIIPDVCNFSLERVTAPSSPKEKSTDKPSKRVLESFPAPVPGIKTSRGAWSFPSVFNSLRVVRDGNVPSSICDCPGEPVAYLRLVEGDGRRYDKLYYRCSFFGVPRRKAAKV